MRIVKTFWSERIADDDGSKTKWEREWEREKIYIGFCSIFTVKFFPEKLYFSLREEQNYLSSFFLGSKLNERK